MYLLVGKNGNTLVTFKDLKVLDWLNKIGSGNMHLPDPMSKRYKPEHFNGGK